MILIGLMSTDCDGPFQLIHAYVRNLGKSATIPKYCLLLVNLFTSNVYVYSMKSRKSVAKKIEIFYKKVQEKNKVKEQYS